jgi:Co/Zn/Cd efflux system component
VVADAGGGLGGIGAANASAAAALADHNMRAMFLHILADTLGRARPTFLVLATS